MFQKIIAFVIFFQLVSCAELNQVIQTLPNATLSNAQIADGLKQALDKGITEQVSLLAVKDGFYKNEMV
ncbi:MAG TPA: DUF4197 family protein, partial [Flavobacteriia bacterium]|nr:DUF4197 family protein [Flavobacteriia bacterium]